MLTNSMCHGGPLQVPFTRSIPVEAAISRTVAGVVVSIGCEHREGLKQFKDSPYTGTYLHLLGRGLCWHGDNWLWDLNAKVIL